MLLSAQAWLDLFFSSLLGLQLFALWADERTSPFLVLLRWLPKFSYQGYYKPLTDLGSGAGEGPFRPRRATHLDPEIAHELGLLSIRELKKWSLNYMGLTLIVIFEEYPTEEYKVEHYDIWKFKNFLTQISTKLREHLTGNSTNGRWSIWPFLGFIETVQKHEKCLNLTRPKPLHIIKT